MSGETGFAEGDKVTLHSMQGTYCAPGGHLCSGVRAKEDMFVYNQNVLPLG